MKISRSHLYILVALVSLHIAIAPWIHLGGEGPEKIYAGYYLAGYDVEFSKTRLAERGEIFNSLIFSLIIRVCDLLQLPIRVSVYAALYSLPLLCSGAIVLAYLLGSDLFDEKAGLLFSLLLGLSYHFWYFSNQTRVTAPCATMMLASVYFFWKVLQKGSKWYWFVLWALFTVLAFETEYFAILLFPFYFLYILLAKRFDLLKNRILWLGIAAGSLVIIPWLYLNIAYTSSIIGLLLGFSRSWMFIRGSGDPLAYIRQIHFYLPFPNFLLLFYGVYVALRNIFHKVQSQANLFALIFFAVILGGMSLGLGFYADWYSPIIIPSAIMIFTIGLIDVNTQLHKTRSFRKYANMIYSGLLILSAITINQIHSFFIFHLENASIHFYELNLILAGFAIPKIINWSNLWKLEPIITYLEGVGKPQNLEVYVINILVTIFLASLVGILLRRARLGKAKTFTD